MELSRPRLALKGNVLSPILIGRPCLPKNYSHSFLAGWSHGISESVTASADRDRLAGQVAVARKLNARLRDLKSSAADVRGIHLQVSSSCHQLRGPRRANEKSSV